MRPKKSRGPTKRTSFDIPVTLHTRVKIECVRRGTEIGATICHLLEREFPAPTRRLRGRQLVNLAYRLIELGT
jgi:hypothetical protein